MASYEEANTALNGVLFSSRSANKPVYLTLTSEAREDVAEALGLQPSELEDALVSAVAGSMGAGDPYWPHTRQIKLWQHRLKEDRATPPPFTALLYIFCLAAEQMHSDDNFSQHNYYGRLAGLLGIPRSRLSQNGRSTERFWKLLNLWLRDNDHALGRPTATTMGSWKYVGYPLSQALVRDSDKLSFHGMFEKFGFSPSDRLSQQELEPYIDEWVRSGLDNKRVARAWAQESARGKLSEIVVEALEEWSGPALEAKAKGRQLFLALSMQTFPTRRFALRLGSPGEGGRPVSGLVREPGHVGGLSLSNDPYSSIATVSPEALLDIARVLMEGVTLRNDGGAFGWTPRAVIPFVRDATGNYWAEVMRTRLGIEHLVLCRAVLRMRQQVEQFLFAHAKPGFSVADAGAFPGFPAGWVLYEKVRFDAVPEDVPIGLEAIAPLALGGELQLSGGVELSRNTFHASRPPLATFIGKKGPTQIRVNDDNVDNTSGELGLAASTGVECSLNLSTSAEVASRSSNGSLNLSVVAQDSSTTKKELRAYVSLRSAQRPLPWSRQASNGLVWSKAWTASDGDASGGACGHAMASLTMLPLLTQTFPLGELAAGEAEEPSGLEDCLRSGPANWEQSGQSNASCVARGYHCWNVEPFTAGRNPNSPMRMDCKNCSASVLVRNRGRRTVPDAAPVTLQPVAQLADAPATHGLNPDDWDVLLDAMCYLGRGTIGRVEAMVSAMTDEPGAAAAAVSTLIALGFVDAAYRPGTGRVSAWCVPPPALVLTANGEGFLSGFRNDALIFDLETLAAAEGCSLKRRPVARRPAFVVVTGTAVAEGAKFAALAKDTFGRPIQVVEDAAHSLAMGSVQMGGLAGALQPCAWGSFEGAEAFDLRRARWVPCDDTLASGAYRIREAGTTYVRVEPGGRASKGDYRIVKLLAGEDAGTPLYSFDAFRQEMKFVLGASPPGLLERALVACTGELPSVQNGIVCYRGVSPELASTVIRAIRMGIGKP